MPRNSRSRGGDVDREFAGQGGLEQGQLLVRTHATKLAFDLQQRRRTPSLFLITGAPACDAVRFRFDARHHTLDQIRGLEARAQFHEHVEAMQRQRFLQAFNPAAWMVEGLATFADGLWRWPAWGLGTPAQISLPRGDRTSNRWRAHDQA